MDYSPLGFSVHGISQARILEKGSGLPCPLPGELPDPGIKVAFPVSSALQADSSLTEIADITHDG